MNTTRIRDALVDVRDAVAVPPADDLAFRRHLRRVRRRRLAARAAVAAAVVGVAAAAPLAWPHRPDASPPDAMRPPAPVEATAAGSFPAAREGLLQNMLPDGSSYATSDRVEEVLGSGAAGIVVIGRDSHLRLVPLMASGQPDRPRDLAGGQAVQRAWLDKSGQYVGFVDLEDRLHLRSLGSEEDLATAALAPGDALAAVGSDRWLTLRDGALSLHTPRGVVLFRSTVPVRSAEIAGDTIASESVDGVEFLDASNGRPGAAISGVSTGSLSPDGRRYVASDSGPDRWYVVDTRTGERQVFAGRPPRARAVSMTWQDDDRFLVLFTDPRQPGNRIVSDCSVAIGRCVERYNDAGDTLQIATR